MDLFATSITANPNATAEVIQRKYVPYNKGTKGIVKRSAESRLKTSIALKGKPKSLEHKTKVGLAKKDKIESTTRSVMTPKGWFRSVKIAAAAFGLATESLRYRMKVYSHLYYYVDDEQHNYYLNKDAK